MSTVAHAPSTSSTFTFSCQLRGFMVQHEVGVTRQQILDYLTSTLELSPTDAEGYLAQLIEQGLIVSSADNRLVLAGSPFRLSN